MKKLLLISAMLGLAVSSFGQTVFSTNSIAAGSHLLSVGNQSIYRIQLTAATNLPVVVEFFDNDSLAAPYYGTNYTTAAYTTRSSFATNLVTSAISITGYTNYFTNSGYFTYTTTNSAATNSMSPGLVLSVPASGSTEVTLPAQFFRGVVVRTTGSTLQNLNYTYNKQ